MNKILLSTPMLIAVAVLIGALLTFAFANFNKHRNYPIDSFAQYSIECPGVNNPKITQPSAVSGLPFRFRATYEATCSSVPAKYNLAKFLVNSIIFSLPVMGLGLLTRRVTR